MEADASAGDRVQIGGLGHVIEPTARTFRERFDLITKVLGVTMQEEAPVMTIVLPENAPMTALRLSQTGSSPKTCR